MPGNVPPHRILLFTLNGARSTLYPLAELTGLLAAISAVSRTLLTLSLGLLLLVGGCTAPVVQHGRDLHAQKVLTWDLGPDRQQRATALCRAGGVGAPEVAQLKQFYYRPAVTNRRGEGLYSVTRFSHLGPIGVLNSTKGVSTVEIGLTDLATQNSVVSALIMHGDRFNPRLRHAIGDHYRH